MSREMLHVNALHFQWQRASAWAFSLPNTRQDVMQACFALEALLSIHIRQITSYPLAVTLEHCGASSLTPSLSWMTFKKAHNHWSKHHTRYHLAFFKTSQVFTPAHFPSIQ